MAIKYPFEIDGESFANMVERDSYSTECSPVFASAITTMDGVDHTVLVRVRGGITVKLNPQTSADAAKICNALLAGPVEVFYHCLQRNIDIYATMVPDALSAQFLSRCLHCGLDWNDMESITLKEL